MKKPLQDLNLTDDILFTLLMQQEAFCRQEYHPKQQGEYKYEN